MFSKRQISELFLLSVIFLIILVTGCTDNSTVQSGNGNINGESQIKVAVSIPPQKEFVESVGGELVDVLLFVPPGASPHTHEPSPEQLKELSKADIYAEVGSGIEFELAYMDKLKGINPGMKIIDCSKGIDLIYGDTGSQGDGFGDPHIWLSPKNARIMVENICEGLCEFSPENEEYFRKNSEEYISKLDMLDKDITMELEGKNGEKIMVYHSAWAYFAKDYSLIQVPVETEGKELTSGDISSLIEQARADNISVIFASPQYSLKSANVVADAINGRLVLIDPLAENYSENMAAVAGAFAEV
ncbi:zinc ABC transporter substrate-binding protein [Methanoplanus sp. FWC-SCC4]|uniref:Zinc ABC transporter substrate-binding protein n=1 Tax=Methanochimaera problematica TaxID=2609417 RepID=A0AA97I3F9_9EURY|nr:zinc ABC transporter substrate-binding protein [Methanoplanus sp. FWC-SCC4]WOF15539.1 zinc ABC transporter substrate-binding protein [Methanoplanus sp. FWC-SCC4]